MPPRPREERSALDLFHAPVSRWFRATLGAPTAAQTGAWPAIAAGRSTLLLAPTGSGKTLAAFLAAIDRLMFAPEPSADRRCRVLYVSPLKALGADVERNLAVPLAGIAAAAVAEGATHRVPTIGVRSGDTRPAERARLARRPPDILITTPESLYLMLTSGAREGLAAVETIIVDEIHALVAGKRGAHLFVSLERLAALTGSPGQRIGLSATQRPLAEVARLLGGGEIDAAGQFVARPVEIVDAGGRKQWDLRVDMPIEALAREAEAAAGRGEPAPAAHDAQAPAAPAAPAVHGEQASAVRGDLARGTGVGTDSGALGGRDDLARGTGVGSADGTVARRGALARGAGIGGLDAGGRGGVVVVGGARDRSKRTGRKGQAVAGDDEAAAGPPRGRGAGAGRAGKATSIWPSIYPRLVAHIRGHRSTMIFCNSRRLAERLAAAINDTAGEELALAHHGSVARERRRMIEERLKAGDLPAIVATSALELGIDVGAVDLVIQIEAPPAVAAGIQRIGRAGHQVGAVSRGILVPKFRGDLLACAAATPRMIAGEVEDTLYPRSPLDVLAQQVVAAVTMEAWSVDELFALVRRAAPFAELPRAAFEGVLDMLSGRYPSDEFAELRPRITWDRAAGLLRPREGARRLAVLSGGTIPDRGTYGVFLHGEGAGRRVGELDEEMVYESRVGDVFVLGASSWRIAEITPDRVLVTPAPGQPGKTPFWHGDRPGRPIAFGRAIGALTRTLAASPRARAVERLQRDHGLDEAAAGELHAYVREQAGATGEVPSDEVLVVERYLDDMGVWRVCVLSPFGARVHAPWALAVAARMRDEHGVDVETLWSDDGMVLRFPAADRAPDVGPLLPAADEIEDRVVRALGSTAVFAARFRENAARALLLPRRFPGKRSPLWAQRQKAADLLAVAARFGSFPMILETYRECMRDVFDLPGLTELLRRIGSGELRVHVVDTRAPSPFAASLLFSYVANFIYDGDAPLAERRAQALAVDAAQLRELLGDASLRELLDPAAIEAIEAALQRTDGQRPARSADAVHDMLLAIGDLTAAEVAARCEPPEAAAERLAALEREGRVFRFTPARAVDERAGEATAGAGAVSGPGTGVARGGRGAGVEGIEDGLALGTGVENIADGLAAGTGAGDGLAPGTGVENIGGRLAAGAGVKDGRGRLAAGAGVKDGRGRLAAGTGVEHERERLALGTGVENERERLARGTGVDDAGPRFAAIEDAGRLRDGLGVAVPMLPAGLSGAVDDPLGDLVGRYARTHAPFTVEAVAARLGLGVAPVRDTLARLAAADRVLAGEFTPGRRGGEWCDAGVLRALKGRSLARLRREVEPVAAAAFGRFLPHWQRVIRPRSGADALLAAVAQLQGAPLLASALDGEVLAARVAGYRPEDLDRLCASGEVRWAGLAAVGASDGRIALYLADAWPLLARPPRPVTTPLAARVRGLLALRGALFFSDMAAETGAFPTDLLAALWELVWAGEVTNDTLVPLRKLVRGGVSDQRRRAPPSGLFRARRLGPPGSEGRWSLLPGLAALAAVEAVPAGAPSAAGPTASDEGLSGGTDGAAGHGGPAATGTSVAARDMSGGTGGAAGHGGPAAAGTSGTVPRDMSGGTGGAARHGGPAAAGVPRDMSGGPGGAARHGGPAAAGVPRNMSGGAGGATGLGGLDASGAAARDMSGGPAGVRDMSGGPAGAAPSEAARALARAEALLERHGVVTREAVQAEDIAGGFSAVYAALGAMEAAGKVRRGYFVAGLGAAQFAAPGADDRLRSLRDPGEAPELCILASTDPANPYGAALPWPERAGARLARAAHTRVVLVDGALVAHVAKDARAVTTFLPDTEPERGRAAALVARAVAELAGVGRNVVLAEIDGVAAQLSPLTATFERAGFAMTSQGLFIRGREGVDDDED